MKNSKPHPESMFLQNKSFFSLLLTKGKLLFIKGKVRIKLHSKITEHDNTYFNISIQKI